MDEKLFGQETRNKKTDENIFKGVKLMNKSEKNSKTKKKSCYF